MRFSELVKKLWGNPLITSLDVDDAKTIEAHRTVIDSKPVLKWVYTQWYKEFNRADLETRHLNAPAIEIGCGPSFLEQFVPGLIKTDVSSNPYAQRVMDAQKLDFPDKSLRAIFMVHVLHHVQYPAKFLEEAQRCLMPGGRLVMIEPSNGILQRFLAKHMEHFEYYDDKVVEWQNTSAQRMRDANMALPWVIFVRDRAKFEKQFPCFKMHPIKYHTYLAYFISGGVGYRAFVPAFCLPLVWLTEVLFTPFGKQLGTNMTFDLEIQGK